MTQRRIYIYTHIQSIDIISACAMNLKMCYGADVIEILLTEWSDDKIDEIIELNDQKIQ